MFHPSPREQALAEAGGCRRKTWPRPSATTMMRFASSAGHAVLHPIDRDCPSAFRRSVELNLSRDKVSALGLRLTTLPTCMGVFLSSGCLVCCQFFVRRCVQVRLAKHI